MSRRTNKIFAIVLCFLLIFQQAGFAEMAAQLNLGGYLSGLRSAFSADKFRPLHLRYLSYDNFNNSFRLLLDKGDTKNPQTQELENTSKTLLNYFFIGLALPNDSFWVNLRPDSEDNVIDPWLAQTDIGRIMLETDLQLKKDTALATSPETPEGRKYWDLLYKKAEDLFGYENVTIPTLTRPWIVPGEIIIRETTDSAYIYKATLKVMLEQDYLKNSATYSFKDPRLKVLNEYSSQLIRELIIPKLTKEVNSSKRYASLRQVYYSLIMAQWFKARFRDKPWAYSQVIDHKNLANLVSKTPWTKTTFFQEYQKSFKDGEYNLQEPRSTPFGQVIRSYFSGGQMLAIPGGVGARGTGAGSTITMVQAASGLPLGTDNLAVTVTVGGPASGLVPENGVPPDIGGIGFKPEFFRLIVEKLNGSSPVLTDIERDVLLWGLLAQDRPEHQEIIDLLGQLSASEKDALRERAGQWSKPEEMRKALEAAFNEAQVSIQAAVAASGDGAAPVSSGYPFELRRGIKPFFTIKHNSNYFNRFVEKSTNAILAVQEMMNRPPTTAGHSEDYRAIQQKQCNEMVAKYGINEKLASRLMSITSYTLVNGAHRQGRDQRWVLSLEGIKYIVNQVLDCYPEFTDMRPEIENIYEIASDSRISVDTSMEFGLWMIESNIKSVLQETEEYDGTYSRLLAENVEINIVFLKWLGNIAELANYPDQQIKARNFLRFFVRKVLRENRDILDAFADLVFTKTDEAIARNQDDNQAVKIIIILAGAEHLGAWLRSRARKTGREIGFGELLLTNAMGESLSHHPDSDSHIIRMAGASEAKLKKYLSREGVLQNNIKHLVMVDTGFKGSLNYLLRSIFEAEGIQEDYLLVCHLHQEWNRVFAFGLNDLAQWQGQEDRLKRFALIIDDGFEAATSSPVRLGDDLSVVSVPTFRPWFHQLIQDEIENLDQGHYPSGGPAPETAPPAPTATAEAAEKTGSSLRSESTETGITGGIDFRNMPIVTQAIGNLRVDLATATLQRLNSVNIADELMQLQRMVNSGITPSSERIKEYVQASCLNGNSQPDMNKIILCISDILRQEEENGVSTEPIIKDILIVLESARSTTELKEVLLGKKI